MAKTTCEDPEGCDRPTIARGLCTKHYQREKAAGNHAPLPKRQPVPCLVEACDRIADTAGLCNAHYKRKCATGDVQADVPVQRKRRGGSEPCEVDGCDRLHFAKGLCKHHYLKTRREQIHAEPCVVEGCDRVREMTTGYCARHYQRLLKYGDPVSGGQLRKLRGTGNRWEYDEQRRAAKAKMSQVTGETAEYVAIIRRDPCVYCGKPREHIDHIDPFADGGPTEWSNLAPACARCNHQKSRQPLLIFLLRRLEQEARPAQAA